MKLTGEGAAVEAMRAAATEHSIEIPALVARITEAALVDDYQFLATIAYLAADAFAELNGR
ncbi:hypothetical protein GL279_14250 [Paracoccus limosus]|uniref:Uncharacterized protein n=1 Tax=Paracoccus limosus TaxID=913252 RepID=A0A844H7P9_9RHOB|nr:hypothetical protein [Paracoccus limosus]MTH35764.1 hypothetical protein [Paracoccus limosus]